jgi:UDP-GlcNAc:undecaprenyl-phosphate/decaprenyl-phosphate GlcNAc-1-phosphate transferase
MSELLNKNYHLIIYVLFFFSAMTFAFLMNNLFLRFFRTLGIRNPNDGTVIRWGAMSKPAVGGITFYITFLLAVACYSVFFSPSQVFYNTKFVGLLLSMALGFIIGLADDAYDTKPLLKFFIQFACGMIMFTSGIRIEIFDSWVLNMGLTVLWVVGIMNSVNMLDNMDGITTIVSIGIILSVIVIILSNRDFENLHLIILVGLVGALMSFLYFNWNPSRMYMGDTGSQFLGALLAAIGIIYLWNDVYHVGEAVVSKKIVLVIMSFILPIIDTSCVVFNRISKGKSPFIGGKDHTTHSLAYMGLSDRQVALVFAGLSLFSVFQVYLIEFHLKTWDHSFTAMFIGYFVLLLSYFFYSTRKAEKRSSASPK